VQFSRLLVREIRMATSTTIVRRDLPVVEPVNPDGIGRRYRPPIGMRADDRGHYRVVRHDHLRISRNHHVHLKRAHPEIECVQEAVHSVFGQQASSATVTLQVDVRSRTACPEHEREEDADKDQEMVR